MNPRPRRRRAATFSTSFEPATLDRLAMLVDHYGPAASPTAVIRRAVAMLADHVEGLSGAEDILAERRKFDSYAYPIGRGAANAGPR